MISTVGVSILVESGGYLTPIIICSRWLTEDHLQAQDDAERAKQAGMDLEDIICCETFVLYSHTREPLPTRQSHSVELGFALGLRVGGGRRDTILVGERTGNVFHYHPLVQHRKNWDEFFAALGDIAHAT